MTSRRDQVLEAAVAVFAEGGQHALTHSAVDRRAEVPAGTTSNHFRSRAALVTAVADRIGQLRLQEPPDAHDRSLALAWFELLIQAQREPWIAEAIHPVRSRMRERVEEQLDDGSSWSAAELMALATGLEFSEAVTGQRVLDRTVTWLRKDMDADSDGPPSSTRAR